MGAAYVCFMLHRLRIGYWRQGWEDRRRTRPRRGPGQLRPARAEWLDGEQQSRPPHPPTDPPGDGFEPASRDEAMHRTGSLTQQMTIQPKVPSKAGKI